MESWLERSSTAAGNVDNAEKKKAKIEPTKCRQYQEAYALMDSRQQTATRPRHWVVSVGRN